MIVKTNIFKIYNHYYKSLPELARAMGISVDQIYRVREGKCKVNRQFIIGSAKAFPDHKLDQLFYFALESPVDKIHSPDLDSIASQASVRC